MSNVPREILGAEGNEDSLAHGKYQRKHWHGVNQQELRDHPWWGLLTMP